MRVHCQQSLSLSVIELLFMDICIFQAISGAEVYGWTWLVKKVLKPIDFALEALQKLAIFQYGRFEFEAVGDKWLHKTNEEKEECIKPRIL